MKTFITVILTAIVSVLLTLSIVNYSTYGLTTVVTEVDNNLVTCEDFNGNLWRFYSDAGDWIVGDYASLVMDNHMTKTIYDDEIISAHYCGWYKTPVFGN